MRTLVLVLASVVASLGPLAARLAGEPDASSTYRVVVAASNPVAEVRRSDLARLFLGQLTRWPDGRAAHPVDQSASFDVRQAFTRDVLAAAGVGRLSSVASYWQQQVFSGRGSPPPVVASDAEVIAHVSADAGGVGYVTAGASLGGAKAVRVVD